MHTFADVCTYISSPPHLYWFDVSPILIHPFTYIDSRPRHMSRNPKDRPRCPERPHSQPRKTTLASPKDHTVYLLFPTPVSIKKHLFFWLLYAFIEQNIMISANNSLSLSPVLIKVNIESKYTNRLKVVLADKKHANNWMCRANQC